MKEKGSKTCKKQCCGDIKSGDQRNDYGRAEHRKHVLQSKNQHLGGSQLTRIVNRALANFVILFTHLHSSCSLKNTSGNTIPDVSI